MTKARIETTRHAELEAFLPLVASAWKEGGISDIALAAVCLEIIQDPDLDLSCREALQQWLDSPDGRRAAQRPRFAAAS